MVVKSYLTLIYGLRGTDSWRHLPHTSLSRLSLPLSDVVLALVVAQPRLARRSTQLWICAVRLMACF